MIFSSMFINATSRQQISIYSIGDTDTTDICLLVPHIRKSGGTKIYFRSLRSRILFSTPTLESAAPPMLISLRNYGAPWQKHKGLNNLLQCCYVSSTLTEIEPVDRGSLITLLAHAVKQTPGDTPTHVEYFARSISDPT